jgi:FkbM family methyltransferase
MNKILKVIKLIRRRFLPTNDDKMADKFREDGGDSFFLFNYDLNKDSVVLDVGGYEGQWASDLFSRFQCEIFIFEVVQSFVDKMEKRFSNNSSIKIYNHGLGNSTRNEKINVSEDSSSLYVKSNQYEEIKIVDFKEWINENNFLSIQLLKMNIEGAEYELLERIIDQGFHKKIDNLLIQFHNFTPDARPRMEKIQGKLNETHNLQFQYDFIWESWKIK